VSGCYFFRSVISSLIHGQKFCGFLVVVAFLMTVIFMSLLHLGCLADRLHILALAAVRCAKLTNADSNAPR
jgi:hypothetical protein